MGDASERLDRLEARVAALERRLGCYVTDEDEQPEPSPVIYTQAGPLDPAELNGD